MYAIALQFPFTGTKVPQMCSRMEELGWITQRIGQILSEKYYKAENKLSATYLASKASVCCGNHSIPSRLAV